MSEVCTKRERATANTEWVPSNPVTQFPVTGWSFGTDLSYARKGTVRLDKLPCQDSNPEENVSIQRPELEDREEPSHKNEENN